MFTRASGVLVRIRPGATTVVSRNPAPSNARQAISTTAESAKPPITEPAMSSQRPISRQRRAPIISASSETARPPAMPATCTTPSRTPACTKDIPSSCWMTGMAVGSFQMCMAAVTPASTTTIHAASARCRVTLGAAMLLLRPRSISCLYRLTAAGNKVTRGT